MGYAFDIKQKIQVFWSWEHVAIGPSALMIEDMELWKVPEKNINQISLFQGNRWLGVKEN